jgi:hypothetical protein|tara:strand:- start:791 stop:997 length:207 start_codon:yes stop_codon:yes gene_type:complete
MVIEMDMRNFFGWVQGVRSNGAGKDNYQAAQNMTGEMSNKGITPEAKSVEDVYLKMQGLDKPVDKSTE